MLQRLLDILGLARSLIALRSELALVLTGKSLALALIAIVAALVASVGTLALLAAAVVALSPVVGYALALAIVGTATIAGAAIVWYAARRHLGGSGASGRPERSSEGVIRARIGDDQRRLHAALGGRVGAPSRSSADNPSAPSSNTLAFDSSRRTAMANPTLRSGPIEEHPGDAGDAKDAESRLLSPTVTLAAGFAAVALFGPSGLARTFRLMTALASVASLARGLRRTRGADPRPLAPDIEPQQSPASASRRHTVTAAQPPSPAAPARA